MAGTTGSMNFFNIIWRCCRYSYPSQRIKGEQMHDQALNYKSTQSSLSMQSFKALIILAIAFIATQGTVTAIADDESNPRKVPCHKKCDEKQQICWFGTRCDCCIQNVTSPQIKYDED
ncbi:hypothetical protein BU17DRAFT_68546 [Hysterangium stoloniferum]|nr:hypothetical protein BU17DRAFT_68546 [Hysterangium stoloniferum]